MRRALLLPFAFFGCVGDSNPPNDSGADVITTPEAGIDAPITDASTGDGDAGAQLPTISNLDVWLRADLGVTKGPPFVWADQSSSGNDATSSADAGAAGSPMVTPNFFNGLPAVVFATAPQILHFPAAFDDLTNGLSYFVVAMPTNTALGTWMDFGSTTSTARIGIGQNQGAAGLLYVVAGTGANFAVADNPAGLSPANEAHVFEVTITGAGNVSFYRDGQTAGTAGGFQLTNTPRTINTIGGGQAGTGAINTVTTAFGEILVYGKVVTPSERAAVEAYLKARWATP